MSSQINDSTYTTKLQHTYTLTDNIEVHSVMLEPIQKTNSLLEPHRCQQLQLSTISQNVTHTSNSSGSDLTITSASSSAQRLQQKCELPWKPAHGFTKTDVQQPQYIHDDSRTFNLSSKSNVVVESCKMVQVEPNKWIQVKHYNRAPAQSTNQNKNPQCRNFGKKSPVRNSNVLCFQNRMQTYKSTNKDAGEPNKNVILITRPRNLQYQKQDSTSIEKDFYQKSDVIIVSLDGMESQFKDFETGKVQSQKASNRKETTNDNVALVVDTKGQLEKQENNSSLQNSPQSNKMQQNKIGGEVPKHSPNINSLIQHENLNTNIHTCRGGTVAYVESSEMHSPAETTKIYSNQHANQLSSVEDHCLPNGQTNPFRSTSPIMDLESRGEIIYSREGTDGGETVGFLHLLDMMSHRES